MAKHGGHRIDFEYWDLARSKQEARKPAEGAEVRERGEPSEMSMRFESLNACLVSTLNAHI